MDSCWPPPQAWYSSFIVFTIYDLFLFHETVYSRRMPLFINTFSSIKILHRVYLMITTTKLDRPDLNVIRNEISKFLLFPDDIRQIFDVFLLHHKLHDSFFSA